MSFSLGGPGDILPPRSKPQDSFKDPRSQPVKQPLVQESVPLDVPPTTKPSVAAGPQPVTVPQGRPASVTNIADRRAKTKSEAVQSAIAQATGNVIPLPNIKKVTDTLRAGMMNPGGSWSQPVNNGGRPAGPRRPGLSKEGLCTAVGIVEAQRHGNSITISGNEGKMRLLAGEELVSAAKSAAALVQKALDAGDVSKQDIADCQAEYCKRAQCKADHSTGAAEKPPANAPPVPTPPVVTDTGSGGTAPATTTSEIPDALLPPALPPATTDALPPTVSVEPLAIKKDEPKADGMSPASKGFLWVAALVMAGVLIKKLSAVKVVGAAVAGVPLVADMGDDEEDEDGDEDEGHDDGAHETDSDENEE